MISLLVTVYTQFGYASVDLDKYKDDSHLSSFASGESSPEKQPKSEDGSGGQMIMNHDSAHGSASGEKIIELQYKWGLGFIQVSIKVVQIY
jgi:hypothetical protein